MSLNRSREHGWLAYYGELFGLWARRSNRGADGEDAIQDAAVSLLESDVSGVEDFRAYLGRTSHNKFVDIHRRRGTASLVPLDELQEHETPKDDGPDSVVQASLLSEALQKALGELPLKCQQVFIWNKIEGYTQEEIARTMGLSQSMVEKHMKRALAHLCEKLHDYAPR